MKSIVEREFARKNWRGLKAAIKDVTAFTDDLPKADYEWVAQRLEEELHISLDGEKLQRLDEVDRIMKQGRIGNDSEYEMIDSRVEEIYTDESKRAEVDRLNKLLAAYHLKGFQRHHT